MYSMLGYGSPDGLGAISTHGFGRTKADANADAERRKKASEKKKYEEEKRRMELMVAKAACESKDISGQVVGTWDEAAQKCVQKSWANEKKLCLDQGGKFDDATHVCSGGTYRDSQGVLRDTMTNAAVEPPINWGLYAGIALVAGAGIYFYMKSR